MGFFIAPLFQFCTIKSMTKIKILIVDDEKSQRDLLSGFLHKNGFDVTTAENGEDALTKYRSVFSPIAIVDMKMPGMNGLELLVKLKEINPFIQVLVLTAFGSVETAVSAMKAGAADYLTKPIEELEELILKLQKAADQNRLIVDNKVMSERINEIFPSSEMIGESSEMQKVKELLSLVAPQDTTLLITGESGTGKELVARAVHALSPRASKKLVAINCAAFPENLLESELFGYEKGAFTGAGKLKQGRFELADGGTLFLDEIGELPLTMQVKLLRVLEERKIERLGSVNEIDLDIRIIAATNRDLEKMIEEKTFREDLYYRLNVVRLDLPSLADRGGDILLLANKFIDVCKKKVGKEIKGITPDAAEMLTSYNWPGNVRELENIIERAIILTRSDFVDKAALIGISQNSDKKTTNGELQTLANLEKSQIEMTLNRLDWSLQKTADSLGIHRNTLRTKIKEYNITQ